MKNITSTILNCETFSLKIMTKSVSRHPLFSIVLEVVANAIKKKERNSIWNGKKKGELCVDHIIVSMENPMQSTKQ